jgi:cytochrome b involved in lipid metabolism
MNALISSYNFFLELFSNRIIIIFEGEKYDITEMQYLHPNGEKIFKKYKNKDITEIFYNNSHHCEIKNPKKILEKYKI